jgi:hypothetical protein
LGCAHAGRCSTFPDREPAGAFPGREFSLSAALITAKKFRRRNSNRRARCRSCLAYVSGNLRSEIGQDLISVSSGKKQKKRPSLYSSSACQQISTGSPCPSVRMPPIHDVEISKLLAMHRTNLTARRRYINSIALEGFGKVTDHKQLVVNPCSCIDQKVFRSALCFFATLA